MIAWFDCPIPPVGKLRDLVIGASDEWMSLKVETLSELFAAAKEAIASSAELPAPFADRLPLADEDIDTWAERVCIQPDRLTDLDRQSVRQGKRGSVRVDLGGRRII